MIENRKPVSIEYLDGKVFITNSVFSRVIGNVGECPAVVKQIKGLDRATLEHVRKGLGDHLAQRIRPVGFEEVVICNISKGIA